MERFLLRKIVFAGVGLCLSMKGVALAHDLFLVEDHFHFSKPEAVKVKVMFGHNFPYPDILVPRSAVSEFFYVGPDAQKREIKKVWEERTGDRFGTLFGEFVPRQEGSYLIAVSRERKGRRRHVPSGKYAKSIIFVGEKGRGNVSIPVGHRIEIVPLKNPVDIKPGDVLPVKILFEGNPLSTYVYATYAGYYSEDEPFPVVEKSNKAGVAFVKIDRPGIWLLVCNHEVNFSATLTFEIPAK